MTDKNYTDITVILDKSGSMSNCVSDTLGGFNTFVKDQQKVDGKCKFNTVLFDIGRRVLYENVDVKDVPELTTEEYTPGGGTALYDALGLAIDNAGKRFARLSESQRPGRVLFVILTDGHENSSREYAFDHIKEMVQRKEKQWDWDFLFIGADMDAFVGYGNLGLKADSYATSGKFNLTKSLHKMSDNVTKYRSVKDKSTVSLNAGIGD